MRQAPLRLARYMRERRPDALLAAMWPLTGIAGLAARLSGYRGRLVASEHTDFRRTTWIKGYERRALRHFGRSIYAPCHSIVAVSEGVADSLGAVAGLARGRIEVIHNPVRPMPPAAMTDEDRRALDGWLTGDMRLIAVGTLKPQKGYDVLLRAFADLRHRRDGRLLILGEGPLRRDLEALARELGVTDSLWMPGFCPNTATFLQHAHVFVLSSNWEGFPNVIVEALAAGVPVVSTDCPSGPTEILASGEYGRLVSVGDPEAMAQAVEATRDSPPDPTPLTARAQDFAPGNAARAYLNLLLGS
jgi:glycosyltransferase involved in cell wall biosynthesis